MGPDPGVGWVRTRGLDRSGPRGLDPGGWTQVVHRAGHRVRTPGWTQGPDPRLDTAGAGLHFCLPRGPYLGAGPRWYTQCYFSKFLLALGSRPGLDTGSGPWAGHRVRIPGWTLREQDYIFTSNFYNNGPILINFISFESS